MARDRDVVDVLREAMHEPGDVKLTWADARAILALLDAGDAMEMQLSAAATVVAHEGAWWRETQATLAKWRAAKEWR